MAKKEKKKEKSFINPIDEDKVTDTPGTLPFPHHVGSARIKPIDKSKVKSRALSAMYEQTDGQMLQIREQIELLADQARRLKQRVEISERIYLADMSFEPLVGHDYFLYEKDSGEHVLSMVGPSEWGKSSPYTFVAKVRLQADHTWDILEQSGDL